MNRKYPGLCEAFRLTHQLIQILTRAIAHLHENQWPRTALLLDEARTIIERETSRQFRLDTADSGISRESALDMLTRGQNELADLYAHIFLALRKAEVCDDTLAARTLCGVTLTVERLLSREEFKVALLIARGQYP